MEAHCSTDDGRSVCDIRENVRSSACVHGRFEIIVLFWMTGTDWRSSGNTLDEAYVLITLVIPHPHPVPKNEIGAVHTGSISKKFITR